MGKTFVYNTGNPKTPVDEMHLEIGVFFDGTLNNLKNSELRMKYRDGKNKMTSTDTEDQIREKEKAIKDTRILQEKEYERLKKKKLLDDNSEYHQYLKSSHQEWLDKQGWITVSATIIRM